MSVSWERAGYVYIIKVKQLGYVYFKIGKTDRPSGRMGDFDTPLFIGELTLEHLIRIDAYEVKAKDVETFLHRRLDDYRIRKEVFTEYPIERRFENGERPLLNSAGKHLIPKAFSELEMIGDLAVENPPEGHPGTSAYALSPTGAFRPRLAPAIAHAECPSFSELQNQLHLEGSCNAKPAGYAHERSRRNRR